MRTARHAVGHFCDSRIAVRDMGQKMQLFNPNSIGYTMLLPLISVIFTLVPIIRKLSKTDLISIIEGR